MCEKQKQRSDTLCALLEYHHKAMEARRSLGFKAFLSLIALELLMLKGAYEIKASVSVLYHLKLLLYSAYGVFCVLFVSFMIQIERVNRKDREKYTKLEAVLWQLAEIGNEAEATKENFWRTMSKSWAGTWPALMILLLTVGCCLVVWQIDP